MLPCLQCVYLMLLTMFILCLGRCGALFWTLQCSPDVANCVCGVQKDVGLGGGSLSVHLMLLTVCVVFRKMRGWVVDPSVFT